MKVGIQLHPQATTVDQMRAAWKTADEMGVDSIWTWDHFYPLYGDPDAAHFEAYTLLAAMAADTARATVGVLVTCFSYRNAQLLADMIRTVDHISGGRAILGLGSGWFERDYTEYGYEFGTAVGRLKALEAGLPVVNERLGKLNPGPVKGRIPLMIGGSGEKMTLRIVAENADMMNVFGPPANVRRKNDILDEWCAKVGRDPRAIERTVAVSAKEADDPQSFIDAGADHLIVMAGSPYDLKPVERLLAQR